MAKKGEEKGKETHEEAVFVEHYERLTVALPVVRLLPKFISKRIITFGEQDKILAGETNSDKRERFLELIRNHLIAGNTYEFYKFLEVLETHGGAYSYLASDIHKSIEQRKQQEQNQEEENASYPIKATEDEEATSSKGYKILHHRLFLVGKGLSTIQT